MLLILLILSFLFFSKNKGFFPVELHNFLAANSIKEGPVSKEFLKEKNLYDDNFVCEYISYENGNLEFTDCIIDEEEKDYCIYNGNTFECYDKNKESNINISFIDNNVDNNAYINEDVILNISVSENSDLKIDKLLYCNTNGNSCIPSKELTTDVYKLDLESESSKVCIMAQYTENFVSEIICSETYKIDKTAPIIEYKLDGVKGSNGWYTSDVVVSEFDAIDNISGINDLTINKESIKYETVGENIIITAIDLAGNKTEEIINIKIDKVAPIAADFNIIGTLGTNNWYTSDITINHTGGSDSVSGVNKTIVSKNKIDYDTKSEVVTLTTYDNAGNSSKKEIILKVDKTAPEINYEIEGTKGDNGWYVTDVEIKDYNAIDNLSGLKSFDINKALVDYETTGENIIIKAVDLAGNIAEENFTIKVDKTEPIAADFDISGNIGNDNWYVTDVIIGTTGGSDSISGIASSTPSKSLINYDTLNEVLTLTTTDNAGHKATKTMSLKVDKTGPVIDDIIMYGAKGNDGWFLSDITVAEPTASDSFSGLVSVDADELLFTNETNGTDLTITAYDKAGNKSEKIVDIKIDKTKPTLVDYLMTGDRGTNDWYVSDVRLNDVVGSDSGSGIDLEKTALIDVLVDYETTGENISFDLYDIAGNKETINVPVKVDLTDPVAGEILFSGEKGNNGWYTSDVEVTSTASTDDVSGIFSATLSMHVVLGDDLNTTVYLTAIDNAGRTSTGEATVKIDKEIPEDGKVVIDGTLGANDWYVSDVEINVEGGFDSGSGLSTVSVNLLSITTNTEGTTIIITTEDNAGNESETTKVIKIDKDSPNLVLKEDNVRIPAGTNYPIIDLFETPNYSISDGTISCTIENANGLAVGDYTSTCTLTGGNGLKVSESVKFTIYEDLDAIKREINGVVSTNGSYVITDFKPSSKSRIEMDFTFLGPRGESVWLFSSRIAYANQMFGIAWNTTESLLQYNKVSYNLGRTAYSENIRHSIDISKDAMILDGVKYVDPSDDVWNGIYDLYIFANNQKGVDIGHNNGQAIIHSFKIYENNVLVMDVVPVETVGNEFALYDKLNDEILETIGTLEER